MKVLYITNVPSPYRVDFFNELSKYCELTVTYEKRNASDRNDKWKNRDSRKFEEIFLKGISLKADGAICPSILAILKRNWDIIIVGGYSTPTGMLAILFLKATKRAFILNADGGFVRNEKGLRYKVKSFFIGSANYWIGTGAMTTKYFVYYGANADKIYEYPFSSIWESEILPQAIGEERKLDLKLNDRVMVISVGQLIERKGFKELLEACALLADSIVVYIIGDKPTLEYEDIIKRLNLKNIEFVGFQPKADLIAYYKSADIFILPTREDIWGLVINEAMSLGLPTITTDKCIAGIEMIADGENGFIVPAQNHVMMAEKINCLANDKKLRESMSGKAIITAQKYTIEKMAEEHYKIFSKILRG